MKRLLWKFLVFLIPFVLLISLFFLFEPYDYLAIKGDSWYMSRSVTGVREVIVRKPSQIILGDSRMANLNIDYIQSLSGESYTNMAYGGATLNESIEQFWFAAQNTTLSRVIFGVDYYTLNNKLYSSERIQKVFAVSKNPLFFLADFGYWIDAAQNAKFKAFTLISELTGDASYMPVLDDPSSLQQQDPPLSSGMVDGYRDDLYEYANIILGNLLGEGGCGINYAFNNPEGYIQRLLDISQYCEENDIELVFVLMPCNRAIWDLVIRPNGIDIAIEIYKKILKAAAIVIDGEFYNDFARDDTRFLDGHHLVLEEKMRLARILFAGEYSPYWLKTTPETFMSNNYELTDQMQLG